MKKPMAERILDMSVPEPNTGCWLWLRATNEKGYPQVVSKGRTRRAHRVSYETFVGPIPDGLEIDHLCRQRSCVNPEHLEPVKHRENVMRGTSPVARNASKTHCPHGHAYSGPNLVRTSRGGRECGACNRQRSERRHRAKRRAA